MTGRNLIISDNARDVLLAARDGKPHAELNKAAVEKCFVRGWIQYDGEQGELLGLTTGGKEACQKLKI